MFVSHARLWCLAAAFTLLNVGSAWGAFMPTGSDLKSPNGFQLEVATDTGSPFLSLIVGRFQIVDEEPARVPSDEDEAVSLASRATRNSGGTNTGASSSTSPGGTSAGLSQAATVETEVDSVTARWARRDRPRIPDPLLSQVFRPPRARPTEEFEHFPMSSLPFFKIGFPWLTHHELTRV